MKHEGSNLAQLCAQKVKEEEDKTRQNPDPGSLFPHLKTNCLV